MRQTELDTTMVSRGRFLSPTFSGFSSPSGVNVVARCTSVHTTIISVYTVVPSPLGGMVFGGIPKDAAAVKFEIRNV